MKIGILGPFNPQVISERFPSGTELPTINAFAASVNTFVRALVQDGHQVTVFTEYPFPGEQKTITGDGIKIVMVSNRFSPRGFGRYRVIGRLEEAVKRELPELEVLHAQWTYEYAMAARSFAGSLPLFCSIRDWSPYLKKKAKGLKGFYNTRLADLMFRQVIATPEIRFLANSPYIQRCMAERCPGRTVSLIPNPIRSDRILNDRSSYPDHPTFISISQNLDNPIKNIDTLLAGFQQYYLHQPCAGLILVGGYSEEWKREREEKGLLRGVELTGALSHEMIFSALDRADTLVHPSLEETFGNILLEAMSRRVLCIGGEKSGAVPDVLGAGSRGILCDVTDPESIAAALRQAHASDRTGMVDRATDYLLTTCSDKQVVCSHIALYSQAIRETAATNG